MKFDTAAIFLRANRFTLGKLAAKRSNQNKTSQSNHMAMSPTKGINRTKHHPEGLRVAGRGTLPLLARCSDASPQPPRNNVGLGLTRIPRTCPRSFRKSTRLANRTQPTHCMVQNCQGVDTKIQARRLAVAAGREIGTEFPEIFVCSSTLVTTLILACRLLNEEESY